MLQALVTGANRGLGLEMTRQLLQRGDRVVAACRHPGKALALTRLAGEHPGKLHVMPLDLADARSIADLAREIGALDLDLDLFVNNAGVLVEGERFGAIEPKSLRDSFAVNAEGPFLLTQALNAAPRRRREDRQSVLDARLDLAHRFAVQPELRDQQGRAEHGDAPALDRARASAASSSLR